MTASLSQEIAHDTVSTAELQQRFAAIQARMAAACEAAGRDASSVRLLPVTKTVPLEVLRRTHALGWTSFAENKVQEAQEKAEALSDLAIDWCIIGRLQRNKARHVARFAHEFHALDDLRTAEELDRRLQAAGRSMRVLVQVNTSGEASKSGIAPDAVEAFVSQLQPFHSLDIQGFMTLAMASPKPDEVRQCFVTLREARDRARQSNPAGWSLPELSMGMSGDFELAIAEGATIIRVGQALFGART